MTGGPDDKGAMELAYGLLWIVGCDRSNMNGQALYLARKALYEQLDKAGQARGITAAREALERNPPLRSEKPHVSTMEQIARDMREGTFPRKSEATLKEEEH